MRKYILLLLVAMVGTSALAQSKHVRHERRPANTPETTQTSEPQKQPTYEYFSILDGMPMLLELHHDTVVGTNTPVDVYKFVIELQIMNSDGNLEPEGLDIFNFYTAKAVNPNTAPNPNNAADCRKWNNLVIMEMQTRPQNAPTWSYVEFTVAQGARILQTNEDGPVWWSDDIECWGARDRFPPF